MDKPSNRVDKFFEELKNHPIIAGGIIFGIIVIALGAFTDSLEKLITLYKEYSPPRLFVFLLVVLVLVIVVRQIFDKLSHISMKQAQDKPTINSGASKREDLPEVLIKLPETVRNLEETTKQVGIRTHEAIAKLEKKDYIREKTPYELHDYLKSLRPLHAEKIMKQSYAGRWARWKGEVSSVSTAWSKGYQVIVWVPPDESHKKATLFSAVFSDDHAYELEQLRIGDQICIEGRIAGDSLTLRLNDAQIISVQDKASEPQAEKAFVAEFREEEEPQRERIVRTPAEIAKHLDELFLSMEGNFHPKAAKGMRAIYQWELTGDGGGHYYAVIGNQTIKVEKGKHPSPNITITAHVQDWFDILDGKLDGQMAFMTGKLRVKGDMSLAMKLKTLFL